MAPLAGTTSGGLVLSPFLWPENLNEAGMHLDRKLQLTILSELRAVYPNERFIELLKCYEDSRKFHGNMFYLAEHGLVSCVEQQVFKGAEPNRETLSAAITAKGLDFLEDDGGLGTILGKMVVKFDDNDLNLLLQAIEVSDGPLEKKSAIKDTIKSLPADRLKRMYMHLLKYGLGKAPDVLQLLQKTLDHIE